MGFLIIFNIFGDSEKITFVTSPLYYFCRMLELKYMQIFVSEIKRRRYTG